MFRTLVMYMFVIPKLIILPLVFLYRHRLKKKSLCTDPEEENWVGVVSQQEKAP